jgi:tetratricopeptide (TPR) repeat protein
VLVLLTIVLSSACGRSTNPASSVSPTATPPSILLITLDTTRADAIGPEAVGIETPGFNALAARGRRFRQAYATVPETLPSHSSMMTGLYPAGHGVHENARHLSDSFPLVAEELRKHGYRTSAFVSSFILARQFGLARGFDVYDDGLPSGRSERAAIQTTDAAIADLSQSTAQPRFMWIHYYDPHYPYTPPEPFRKQYIGRPYLGEIAAMDQQLARLVDAFERHASAPVAILVAADHGEGLGDHGEALHGNLLFQSTMHVPLVIVGPGVMPGISDTPVSTRQVFQTIMDWAGLPATDSLRAGAPEVVLGEAMKPFLEYGWLPQVMAIEGRTKAILAGKPDVYDVVADPREANNLGAGANLTAGIRKSLDDYPTPSADVAHASEKLDDDARRRLASLGYVGATSAPVVRRDAPRPADMTALFSVLEEASAMFAAGNYAGVIPLLERIRAQDPQNLDVTLRLATAHSALGQEQQAIEAFRRAAMLAPQSKDVRLYLALHYARGAQWPRAVPMLEEVLAADPDRLPALEALAAIRERQGRLADAIGLRQKIHKLRTPSATELLHLGALAMSAQQTLVAIESLERARALEGAAFTHDLELGVLFLAARRFEDARAALDRVPPSNPEYPMALFKRAQVSVLLNEPDRAARIDLARRKADATTRPLIERERLFRQ